MLSEAGFTGNAQVVLFLLQFSLYLLCCIVLEFVIKTRRNTLRKRAGLLTVKAQSAILRSAGRLQLEVQSVVIEIRTCKNFRELIHDIQLS